MAARNFARATVVPAKDSRVASSGLSRAGTQAKAVRSSSKLREILSMAEEKGLLAGARTLVVRGRMPVELVAQAKRRTGITSDSKLLEAGLASLALSDDYAEWLMANRGTVSPDLDLEF
jgi:hypothetical protein